MAMNGKERTAPSAGGAWLRSLANWVRFTPSRLQENAQIHRIGIAHQLGLYSILLYNICYLPVNLIFQLDGIVPNLAI